MTNDIDYLLEEVEQLDPDLAAELRAAHNRAVAIAERGLDVQRAEQNLHDVMREYDDPTGQDLDGPEVEAAARDLIDARDAYLRESDPWRYSEMRAMGQLR